MPWGDRTLGFYVVETAYGPALFDSGRTTGIPALEAGLARSHAEDPHDSP